MDKVVRQMYPVLFLLLEHVVQVSVSTYDVNLFKSILKHNLTGEELEGFSDENIYNDPLE